MTLGQRTPFGQGQSRHASDAPISLHDLLARGTPVEWDEAVAIIEEMCGALVAAAGDAAPIPELQDILIGKEGAVTLRDIRGEKSPTAAGRALHALLSNANVPVPLRLFVTQSTAPETHSSLRAFAEGLAYFGRPNRADLIRDVYARAADLMQSGAQPILTLPPAPVQEKQPAKQSAKSNKLDVKRAVLWSAAFVLVAVAAVAAWTWWRVGSPATPTERAGVLSQAAAAVTDLAHQVRERLKPAVADAEAPTETPTTSSLRRPSRRAPSPAVAEETPLAGRALAIAQPDTWQLPVAVPPVEISASAEPNDSSSFDTEQSVPAVNDTSSPATDFLFTRQDADVKPPVMRYPQLTPPLKANPSRAPAVNSLEVVVAPDGTVERARFIAGPIRMMDIMLLSSVKNWRFTPAFKNGEPVRYQTVISWLGEP